MDTSRINMIRPTEIYLAEAPVGNDETADGTREKPYATFDKIYEKYTDAKDHNYRIMLLGIIKQPLVTAAYFTISGTEGARYKRTREIEKAIFNQLENQI